MDSEPPPPGTAPAIPTMPQMVRLSGANLLHETTPFGFLNELSEHLETPNPLPQEPQLARLAQDHPLRSYSIPDLQAQFPVLTPWTHVEVKLVLARTSGPVFKMAAPFV